MERKNNSNNEDNPQSGKNIDELASRAMNITKQDLQFIAGLQVSQIAETEIMDACRENHTYTN